MGDGAAAVEVDGEQANVGVVASLQRRDAFVDRRERLRRVGQHGFG